MTGKLGFIFAAASVAAGLAVSGPVLAGGAAAPSEMSPGKGVSLDIGGKHTMSYFGPKRTCAA
jgi:hypothetical protein